MTGVLSDPLARAERLRRVNEHHVRPLNDLVRHWRRARAGASIPWFDPCDGGVHAHTLVLMEAPGPRTASMGNDGFCSEDNDDPTAAFLRRARDASGLRRAEYVRWNVVPWLPLADDGRPRAPRASDIEQAYGPLQQLRAELGRLRLVITVGLPALQGWTRYQTLSGEAPVPLLGVPHPSRQNTRARAESELRWRHALEAAVSLRRGGH